MMRVWFILFAFITIELYGQDSINAPLVDSFVTIESRTICIVDAPPKTIIRIDANVEANSSALTNEFIGDYFFRKSFIDKPQKDRVQERLKPSNRLGGIQEYGVTVDQRIGSKGKWLARFSMQDYIGIQFSEDAFNLAFYGNADYAGVQADLSPLQFQRFQYQTLSFGWSASLPKQWRYRVYLDAHRLGNYQFADTDELTFFTETSGEYLELEGKLDYGGFNNSASFLGSGVGAGLSLSGQVSKTMESLTLHFKLDHFGFMRTREATVYSGDGAYRYEGQVIEDPLNPSGSFFEPLNPDSLASLIGLEERKESLLIMSPFTAGIHYNYLLNQRLKSIQLFGVLQYRHLPGYIPRLSSGVSIPVLRKCWAMDVSLAYGGFGDLDFIVGTRFQLAKHLSINIQALALEYLVIPKSSAGLGLQAYATAYF
jgi:hypothetical protein